MAEQNTQRWLDLPKLTLLLMAALTVAGLMLNGLPDQATLNRIWSGWGSRLSGTFNFRFYLQPVMAGIAAALDGLRDARTGKEAFVEALITESGQRRDRLNESLASTARILLLGLAMDTGFQIIDYHQFYPFEAVIVAILLCYLPYVILRGPFRRLAGWWLRRPQAGAN